MATNRAGLAHLLLGQPALSQAVSRGLATKGDQPQTLDEKYSLSVQAYDLTLPEMRYTQRRLSFHHNRNVPAVAAQLGIAFFQPPTVFGGVARFAMTVIERVILTNLSAARLGWFYGIGYAGAGGVGAGATQGTPYDDRPFSPNGAQISGSALSVGSNAANPLATGGEFVSVAAGTSAVMDGPWILTGKDNGIFTAGFLAVADQSNTAFQIALRWYERELLASEQ